MWFKIVIVTMATSNYAVNQNGCFLLTKIYQVGKKEETCFFHTSLVRNNSPFSYAALIHHAKLCVETM